MADQRSYRLSSVKNTLGKLNVSRRDRGKFNKFVQDIRKLYSCYAIDAYTRKPEYKIRGMFPVDIEWPKKHGNEVKKVVVQRCTAKDHRPIAAYGRECALFR